MRKTLASPDFKAPRVFAGVPWEFVIESALRLRKLLQDEGLDSWPKTTGGKGLHLMVPIERDISHDAARLYSKRLAQRLEAADPARYTTSSAPAKRHKRIYIDYLRNGRGTTAVGAYSPRARERFTVAAPRGRKWSGASVRMHSRSRGHPQRRRGERERKRSSGV